MKTALQIYSLLMETTYLNSPECVKTPLSLCIGKCLLWMCYTLPFVSLHMIPHVNTMRRKKRRWPTVTVTVSKGIWYVCGKDLKCFLRLFYKSVRVNTCIQKLVFVLWEKHFCFTYFNSSKLFHQWPPYRFTKGKQSSLQSESNNLRNIYLISLWKYTPQIAIYAFISEDFQNSIFYGDVCNCYNK